MPRSGAGLTIRFRAGKPRRSISSLDGLVAGSANDGNLFRPESLPLLDQMAKHRSLPPRQEQLGLSHARGPACGQDDHTEGEGRLACARIRIPRRADIPVCRLGGFPVSSADLATRKSPSPGQECLPYKINARHRQSHRHRPGGWTGRPSYQARRGSGGRSGRVAEAATGRGLRRECCRLPGRRVAGR